MVLPSHLSASVSFQASLLRGTVVMKDGGPRRKVTQVWYLSGDVVSMALLLGGRETTPMPRGAAKGLF